MSSRRSPISLRLDGPDETWLRQHAEADHIAVNEAVKRAVRLYRNSREGFTVQDVPTTATAAPAPPAAPVRPRPPAASCAAVLTLELSPLLLACWLPKDHEGPHLDAVDRVEWIESDLTREQAAELLAPRPPRCELGQHDAPDAAWLPLFGAHVCARCAANAMHRLGQLGPDAARGLTLAGAIERLGASGERPPAVDPYEHGRPDPGALGDVADVRVPRFLNDGGGD